MNNQKGGILISLLLVIIVLSILSIGVYSISYSASRQAQFTRDNAQAYYIAKAGADLVIDDIISIVQNMNEKEEDKKTLEIEFPNEGNATVDVELLNENNAIKEIHIESTGLVKEGKLFGSKNKIQAKLMNNGNLNGAIVIFGVDNDGNIYKFNKNFEDSEELDVTDNQDKKININRPMSFAWDGNDTLILVGNGESDCIISNDLGKTWETKPQKQGNGLDFVFWSEDYGTFYATQTKDSGQSNSGKIFYLDPITSQWKESSKPTEGFKIEKLVQSNDTIVGISKDKKSKITYFKGNLLEYGNKSKDWEIANMVDLENKSISGTYNAITYGDGKFVIVGNNDGKGIILIIDSKTISEGINNDKKKNNNKELNIKVEKIEVNGKLNDVVWTGEKFIAVGDGGTIYTSNDSERGIVWEKVEDIQNNYNFNMVSSHEDYIIAYSQNENAVLISDDGGKSWVQKQDYNYPKLIDIIVISKGDGTFDPNNYNIQWSR